MPIFAPRPVHIIAFPGFGREPLLDGSWGVPEYAAWTRERLASLGLSEFVLLGHSFGGRVAALLASEGVPGLDALILYGAPLLYRPSWTIRLRITAAKLSKLIVPHTFRSRGNAELANAEARGMGEIFRKAVIFDQGDTLPRITVPTLLVWGERDEAVPLAIAREAAGLIGGSVLSLLPGLSHNAHQENPALFTGVVSRFLDSHERPPALR